MGLGVQQVYLVFLAFRVVFFLEFALLKVFHRMDNAFYLFFYLCFASYVDSLRVERFIERPRRKRTVISFFGVSQKTPPKQCFHILACYILYRLKMLLDQLNYPHAPSTCNSKPPA